MIFFKMPDFVTSPSQPVKSKDFYLKKENHPKLTPDGSALTPTASSHY